MFHKPLNNFRTYGSMVQTLFQTAVSSFFLFLVLLCAYISNIRTTLRLRDFREILELVFPLNKIGINVKTSQVVSWYAKKYGFEVEEHHVTTEDGWVLQLERIYSPEHQNNIHRVPVILQHGLFQSSGIFVVANKGNSLAFYLAARGYDVWLGNNRAVHDKHTVHTPKDDSYWDWSLDELGRYDFAAIVQYVALETNQKVIFCGHSQGNAQAFIGLAVKPEIAQYINLFVAMAPAYFVNEFRHWSLKGLQHLPEQIFSVLFGRKSFVSVMHPCQYHFHQRVFSSIAYNMFAYLFGWTSDKWKRGSKPAIFQTTPRPISTKLIQHWLKVSKFGKLALFDGQSGAALEYLLSPITCPVAVFWGKDDSLVDGKKLINALRQDGVNVVFEHGVDGYEHMDLIWASDAVDTVFHPLEGLLQKFADPQS